MERPSSTACTMVAKLSSANTMSLASFATSVPVMPIAIPMSACLSAGASLTPSPVMAAISPSSLRILTISCLCFGSVRLNTAPSAAARTSTLSSSVSISNSRPVKERIVVDARPFCPAPFCLAVLEARMPIFSLMASAVSLLSPVIIMTLMPAWWHSVMEPATSGRGGSMMPTRPTYVIPCSILTKLPGSVSRWCARWEGPL
mmetsp:Transcript_28004/g.69932  ORF Transcript_28004/g.69932 Transcript_28004/m.69932 type:complete len:202 (+) Transcript_28004:1534-2139(+)